MKGYNMDETDNTQNNEGLNDEQNPAQNQQQDDTKDPTEQTQEQDPAQQTDELLEPDGEDDTPQTVPYARFNEVYYQKKQAEKELEALRAQQQQQAPQPQEDSTKPRLEQFDYDEEKFHDALMDWKLEQRERRTRQQQQQAQQQQQYQEFGLKQQRYMQKNPSYQQLAMQADRAGVQFNESLVEMIMTSDVGVQLHHHLLSNPDKLERLNNGNSLANMRELMRLEQTFSKQKPKPVSKAPEPITPTGGGARDSKPTNERLGKMSPQEYYEYRMAQKNRK